MAYSYTWPSSLPQVVQKGFSETGGSNVIAIAMDAGPSKIRNRGLLPNILSVTFIMTDAQLATFETFVKTTLRGVARFGFPHPRTNQLTEMRLIPEGNGVMYNISYLAPGYYNVQVKLEVLT